MAREDWPLPITDAERSRLHLDRQWMEEVEARREEREGHHIPPRAETVAPRDPAEVAAEFVARVEAKWRAGQYVDTSDKGYTLVLMLRHRLKLASDFERALRDALGWRQREEPQPPAPEPYEEHAMGLSEQQEFPF